LSEAIESRGLGIFSTAYVFSTILFIKKNKCYYERISAKQR